MKNRQRMRVLVLRRLRYHSGRVLIFFAAATAKTIGRSSLAETVGRWNQRSFQKAQYPEASEVRAAGGCASL